MNPNSSLIHTKKKSFNHIDSSAIFSSVNSQQLK